MGFYQFAEGFLMIRRGIMIDSGIINDDFVILFVAISITHPYAGVAARWLLVSWVSLFVPIHTHIV